MPLHHEAPMTDQELTEIECLVKDAQRETAGINHGPFFRLAWDKVPALMAEVRQLRDLKTVAYAKALDEILIANVELDNLRHQMADMRASCDQQIKECDQKLTEVHAALVRGNNALETVIKQRDVLKAELIRIRRGGKPDPLNDLFPPARGEAS